MMRRSRWLLSVMLAAWGPAAVAAEAPGGASPAGEHARLLLAASGVRAGLCVHLGCGDGALTAGLAAEGKFLVHGLTADRQSVAGARATIAAGQLYGKASVDACDFEQLPYADDMVNLVLAEDWPALSKAGLTLKEVMRVLRPAGVALLGGLPETELKAALAAAGLDGAHVAKAGALVKVVKPRPAGMGEWTHALRCGPDGNKVSRDTAGPPTGLRWTAGPAWPIGSRRGDFQAIAVTKDHVLLASSRSLAVRDAFNGLLLWERPLSLQGRTRKLHGAFEKGLCLAASDALVYTPQRTALVALEAATGRKAFAFAVPKGGTPPVEVLCAEGTVVFATMKKVRGLDAASGKLRWEADFNAIDLVAGDGMVFFLEIAARPYEIVCLNLATGEVKWRTSAEALMDWPKRTRKRERLMSLCLYRRGMVIVSNGGRYARSAIHAVSADDGSVKWGHQFWATSFINSMKTVYCARDLVWIYTSDRSIKEKGVKYFLDGHDLLTGERKKRVPAGPGTKCQMPIATQRFFLGGKYMRYFDPDTGKGVFCPIAFGGCYLAFVPANGMIYTLPQDCACRKDPLRGTFAAAPAAAPVEKKSPGGPLEKGEAFGRAPPAGSDTRQDEWPTLRHNPRRTAATPSAVPTELKLLWQRRPDRQDVEGFGADWGTAPVLGAPITAPTVAEGKVFFALPESHRVCAVDAETGQAAWSYTVGARVDSAPTVTGGLCLFGCRDGWVYCLTARDGKLVWRFRAAPAERKIVAYGRLESLWPVPGNILVEKGKAFFTAGRTTGADGGLYVYALDVATGKVVWTRRQGPSKQKNAASGRNSVMIGDGVFARRRGWLYDMKDGSYDRRKKRGAAIFEHTSNNLVDDFWPRYPAGQYHRPWGWRWGGYYGVRTQVLAHTPEVIYGARNGYSHGRFSPSIFAVRKRTGYSSGAHGRSDKPIWRIPLDKKSQAESIILAGAALFVAGPVDRDDRKGKGGFLWALSPDDGQKLSQRSLSAPAHHDGLVAAYGRLYVAIEDGRLLCLGAK